jgi:hypothetical protein
LGWRKTHGIADTKISGGAAKNSIRWKVRIPGAKNDGIKNEVLVDKTYHSNHRNGYSGAKDVVAQFADVVEKGHLAALIFQALMFVLLI